MSAPASAATPAWMYHAESEHAVLGALLMDNGAFDRVADLLRAEDFYVGGHRLIYRTICTLLEAGGAADVVTLDERLSQPAQAPLYEQMGGITYLGTLATSTPSTHNVRRYAEVVRERAQLRGLYAAATRIHDMVASGTAVGTQGVQQVLDAAQAAVLAVGEGRRGSEFVGVDRVIADVMAFVDGQHTRYKAGEASKVTGVPTGFDDLDALTSGLQPGQLVIIAARPAMGKSAFVLNLAEHGARATQRTALMFSLEMSNQELGLRMLAGASQVNIRRLAEGRVYDHEWARVANAGVELSTAPVALSETVGLSIGDLRAVARRAMREYGGLSMIVIDYLQIMVTGDTESNRANALAEITRGLKLLAKEMQVPVIALSQLNRELERRQNKRPVMSDLRESGAIEQDADVIVFIYRDEVYNPATPDKGVAEIIVGKQRNGPTGTVHLAFRADQTRFVNMDQAHMSNDDERVAA